MIQLTRNPRRALLLNPHVVWMRTIIIFSIHYTNAYMRVVCLQSCQRYVCGGTHLCGHGWGYVCGKTHIGGTDIRATPQFSMWCRPCHMTTLHFVTFCTLIGPVKILATATETYPSDARELLTSVSRLLSKFKWFCLICNTVMIPQNVLRSWFVKWHNSL